MIRRVCVLCLFSVLFAAMWRQRDHSASPDPVTFVPQALAEENENRRRDYELIEVLADALDEIDRSYVHEVSREELVEAAIHGMMSELDRNSQFITGDAAKPLRRKLQGEYNGIGIELATDGKTPRVLTPVVGSPAYKARIRPGDQITAIGGESTAGEDLQDVVGRLRGEAGTTVELTVVDAETNKQRTVKLEAAPIKIETVFGATRNQDDTWNFMLDDVRKIGYIRLTTFSRTCIEPLSAAINQLIDSGARGLVFDLRFNEGGYLPETFRVVKLFLSKGDEIVTIRGRGALRGVYSADRTGPWTDLPLAVLVNRRSGSGSEIVASCLQDVRPRTVVVGERTYGKGTVQSLIALDEGRSLLKLTTAEYRRPSGENIHRFPNATDSDVWGVTPDAGFEVALDQAETSRLAQYLRVRQAARNCQDSESNTDRVSKLFSPQVDTSLALSTTTAAEESAFVESDDESGLEENTTTPFIDRQLERAVEYLHSQLDAAP